MGATGLRRAKGTGSIGRRPDGRWVARYTDADGLRRAIYTGSRLEAEVRLQEALAPVRAARLALVRPPRPFIAERHGVWEVYWPGPDGRLKRYRAGSKERARRALRRVQRDEPPEEPRGAVRGPAVGARLRFRVLARAGFACTYCHRRDVELHVDHALPRVHGGTNDEENLVAACADCNLGKATQLLPTPAMRSA